MPEPVSRKDILEEIGRAGWIAQPDDTMSLQLSQIAIAKALVRIGDELHRLNDTLLRRRV